MITFQRPLIKRSGETGARGGLHPWAHLFRWLATIRPGQFLSLIILTSLIAGLASCRPAIAPGPGEKPPDTSQSTGLSVRKVITSQEGIYALGAGELAGAGMDLSAVDNRPIRMYWRGQPIPVWIDRDLGELRFFARPSQSIYSRANTYWLIQGDEGFNPDAAYWSKSEEMPQEPNQIPAQTLVNPEELPEGIYDAAVHLEENTQYYPQVEQGDHWLWVTLPAPQTREFNVSLPEVEPVAGAIRMATWARTEGPGEIDHHLKIFINGQLVVEERWDGKGDHVMTALVPEGLWKSGENTIQVAAPGDTGNVADVVVVNWIDVVFGQKFQAQDDRLFFAASGQSQPLQSFNRPVQAYDVTDPWKPEVVDPARLTGDTFTGQSGHLYWLVGANGGLAPDEFLAPDESLNLRADTTGAAYIAIGPPDLLAPLQPLLDYRSQNGLKVMAVPLQSVFDQFNGGIPEPQAIRAFLQFASRNWQQKPIYLLLVGDATYDPLGYQAPPEANRLPVFLVETSFGGETASDVIFTQLDDDASPDLAVGRIPAQSPDQVSVLVAKTLAFEQQPADAAWKQKILAVADGQEETFKLDAQRFLDLFPAEAQTDLLAPKAGATDVSQQIVERLNQGDGLVAYFGHGSVNMWGKDRLFSTDDVPRLQNTGRFTVMINMTCLTGLFTHPKVESLAEAMLWQPEAGAAAVLAPTSLTLPADQSFLSQPLVEAFLSKSDETLGEALLHARQQISAENPGSLDVMETFLLLGDPALRVPKY
jgi:hypothetical protein